MLQQRHPSIAYTVVYPEPSSYHTMHLTRLALVLWIYSDKNADDDHLQDANGLGNGGWGQGHFCADDGFTLYLLLSRYGWKSAANLSFSRVLSICSCSLILTGAGISTASK
jgi:hypothetical protein